MQLYLCLLGSFLFRLSTAHLCCCDSSTKSFPMPRRIGYSVYHQSMNNVQKVWMNSIDNRMETAACTAKVTSQSVVHQGGSRFVRTLTELRLKMVDLFRKYLFTLPSLQVIFPQSFSRHHHPTRDVCPKPEQRPCYAPKIDPLIHI